MSRGTGSRKTVALSDRITALARATEIADGRVAALAVARAREVLDRAGARRSLSADHTVVGFFGATGSGKSSLFNAVVGQDLARTAVRRPTTSQPLAAVWGEAGSAALLDWLEVSDRHVVGPAPTVDARGRFSLRGTRDAAGGGLVLLDLPDFDSVTSEHRQIVQRMVGLVDVVVWVVDPQKYADAVLHQDFVRPLSRHGAVTMTVLNQADRLAPADLPLVLDSLRELLAADGLPTQGPSAPVAVSAVTGDGIEALRERILDVAARRAAAGLRLEADLRHAAHELSEHAAGQSGDGTADSSYGGTGHGGAASGGAPAPAQPQPTRASGPAPGASAQSRLTDGLARAAGTDQIARAAQASYRLRAGRHTGWIATRWLGRFRRDPLRRLHVQAHGAAADPAVHRTSLPPMNAAQRAAADAAVRGYADEASRDAGPVWRRSIRAAARSHEAQLPDALDQAVAGTRFPGTRAAWWWLLFDVAQWLAMAVTVLGLVWLLGLFVADYFQIPLPPPPTVEGFPLPVPTLAVLTGVVVAIFLAVTGRVLAALVASVHAGRVRRRVRTAVAEVGRRLVVAPVTAELEARTRFAEAVAIAAAPSGRR